MSSEESSTEEMMLALRVKSKKSQNAVLRNLSTKETVQSFIDKLARLTGVPVGQIALLKGFPPQRISYNINSLVESLGLRNQDTIIVEEDSSGSPSEDEDEAASGSNGKKGAGSAKGRNLPAYGELLPSSAEHAGLLLRQIVPSDNSCLFTSVTYCLSGQLQSDPGEGSTFLREMIANTVAANPTKYHEAMLGRPNPEYVEWIKKPESWGGGIELSILAEFYGMQISVVDTQSLHISCFGEDQNYTQRIFLIYDGIHYDPLYFEPFTGGANRTIFETNDAEMLDRATQLAREAKASNQYTDVKNFSLRCQMCNTLLKGEAEAQEHAKKTSHTAFAEIQKP